MRKTHRELSIELLRLVMMFGVVLLHVSSGDMGVGRCLWQTKIRFVCVPTFVFISGYYGMRFSVRKILDLYGVAFVYCVASFLLAGHCGFRDILVEAWHLATGGLYWFLNAFALLMCVAPALNMVSEKGDRKSAAAILIAVFGWGFLLTVPYIRDYLPQTPGVQPFSAFTLAGIYLAARRIRFSGIEKCLSTKMLIIILPLLVVGMLAGFNDYNSPVTLCAACAIFLVVKRLGRGRLCPTWVLFLARSAFPIYIIHLTPAGKKLMSHLGCEVAKTGLPLPFVAITVAAIVFFVCLMIDQCRQLFQYGIHRIRAR